MGLNQRAPKPEPDYVRPYTTKPRSRNEIIKDAAKMLEAQYREQQKRWGFQ